MKRYDLEYFEDCDGIMVEYEYGDWVKAEDALKEIEDWKKEYDELYELYLNAVEGR